jgi:hypothetical protein
MVGVERRMGEWIMNDELWGYGGSKEIWIMNE